MNNEIYKMAGHIIRWFLELLVIWLFVFNETGAWTAFALTMITVGIEFDHFKISDWRKL
jgi:hypothetical protein